MRRIAVIGNTSAGKTTLAQQLAERLAMQHVELDALYWDANWTPAPPDVFRQRVSQALGGDAWAVDGSYSSVRDVVWTRADTIVWLDYPLPLLLWRLWKRTIWRITKQPELWNGNRETWRGTFLSRDSLLLWIFKTHRKKRRDYPAALALPEYAHLALVHLRSTGETRDWLASVPAAVASGQPQR